MDNTIKATPKIVTIYDNLRELDAKARMIAENEMHPLIMRLKDFIGTNEFLVSKSGIILVEWKSQKEKRFNLELLKANQPELYLKYLEEKEKRPFRAGLSAPSRFEKLTRG